MRVAPQTRTPERRRGILARESFLSPELGPLLGALLGQVSGSLTVRRRFEPIAVARVSSSNARLTANDPRRLSPRFAPTPITRRPPGWPRQVRRVLARQRGGG